ncbi:ParA family protein [Labrenzia sp. R4_1]|uniref:ParA family protein n=1 Tax=Labrenzia sp. R4_1 TaxID=2821106 RepID=UPI001ADB3F57|nr:ParA family protein [Labrenzia sp. R4_1]MBO9427781.1 ParA family protein [Labrenzia sp. R4_1]
MTDFVIAVLSQKGGVGKSTFTRLIATAYAKSNWTVKIAGFNTKQKTSVNWAARRMHQGVTPEIPAEVFSSMKKVMKEPFDLVICDGWPDSDATSLDIAKEADVIIIPSGVSLDDLRPQVMFANELLNRGIKRNKILFVMNKTADSQVAIQDAQEYVTSVGYAVTENDLAWKTEYQIAQNSGRSVMETLYKTLNDRAIDLVNEIIKFGNDELKENAA